MNLTLYMDHHVPAAITEQLRRFGVDVLTAEEDGTKRVADPLLLDRATRLGRVLFTRDTDFLAEAAKRQAAGGHFAGIVYAAQMTVSIGQCVRDLHLICEAGKPEDLADMVWHLPL